jgi:hypothetical protein
MSLSTQAISKLCFASFTHPVFSWGLGERTKNKSSETISDKNIVSLKHDYSSIYVSLYDLLVSKQHSLPGSVTLGRGQSLRSRSLFQKPWYQRKGLDNASVSQVSKP